MLALHPASLIDCKQFMKFIKISTVVRCKIMGNILQKIIFLFLSIRSATMYVNVVISCELLAFFSFWIATTLHLIPLVAFIL